jgi:hypothetical protein
MKFVAFLIILIILYSLLEKIINKALGVQKGKISETKGKNIDRWGRSIIIFTFIILSSPLHSININFSLILMLYWLTLLGFQAIMEYIYFKNSKQYISTTILLILGLMIIYIGTYFFHL